MFAKPAALCIKRTNNIAAWRADVNHYVPMQDRTIDNALLALRKEIVRHGRDGLDHVEALLTLRGVELPEYTRRLPINGTY
ncbi:MAG: hypothetical protein FH759_13765, partial [Sediminimonas qiaohouensis]